MMLGSEILTLLRGNAKLIEIMPLQAESDTAVLFWVPKSVDYQDYDYNGCFKCKAKEESE